ncbi:hypothetical protein FHT02_001621, partial [Sphingomonas xinjiangensis]|nr:hypothetical protein [Sphingomonas xinjiangensis]
MVYRGGCVSKADGMAAPSRTMPGSGSNLTSCIEGRSESDGAFRRS